MSAIQSRAAMRWLILCLQHDGKPVTLEMARQWVPKLFDLEQDELRYNESRNEPAWFRAMGNFRRTVGQGKEKYFARVGDGLVLSDLGRAELLKTVSLAQMRLVARWRCG